MTPKPYFIDAECWFNGEDITLGCVVLCYAWEDVTKKVFSYFEEQTVSLRSQGHAFGLVRFETRDLPLLEVSE